MAERGLRKLGSACLKFSKLAGLTMSDFGATDHSSLHRLDRPLTTSTLLPRRRKSPITLRRQSPILRRTN